METLYSMAYIYILPTKLIYKYLGLRRCGFSADDSLQHSASSLTPWLIAEIVVLGVLAMFGINWMLSYFIAIAIYKVVVYQTYSDFLKDNDVTLNVTVEKKDDTTD